ncbi:MAG: HlyD family efflux transporter periplasmic adaptor subunit [Planctomycetes bacterium]|nr:HlyD family efflux transporter periplasmic adaptor subunit [Planctomycetota bacterium]MBI3847865.1 HlyD family efflux transporter periplasmic adaptor subunit [Planctomycetota bacterium]
MIPKTFAPFLLAASILGGSVPASADEGKPRFMKIEKGTLRVAIEKNGLLLPAEPAEVRIWPEAYGDSMQILEVAAAGTTVKAGDVLLRLDPKKIDEQIKSGEVEIRAADQRLKDTQDEMTQLSSDTPADIARAEKDLDLAEKRLRGFKDVELALSEDETQLSKRYHEAGIENSTDELNQLGKMYKEDELTAETEEIVLRRSKRDLENQKSGFELFKRRRAYSLEFEIPSRLAAMINEVADRSRGLDRMRRSAESRRINKELDLTRARRELERQKDQLEKLRRDRELFTLRAPAAGVVYHGGVDPSEVKAWKRGGFVGFYDTLFTIAAPGRVRARFPVGEADLFRLKDGMSATVKPTALPDMRIGGRLDPIDRLPAARGDENSWNAFVAIAEADSRLVPSMKCKVEIVIDEQKDVLLVPASALFDKPGETSKVCYVQKGDEAKAQKVTLGATDGPRFVVKEGLSEGDTVLLFDPNAK